MQHTLTLVAIGLTCVLGLVLAGSVLREVRSPALVRRMHLAAGVAALFLLWRSVELAATSTTPQAGPTGRLPLAFLAIALLLGLSLWPLARHARQGLTLARALHVCMGFCGLILAAAWLLRPGH